MWFLVLENTQEGVWPVKVYLGLWSDSQCSQYSTVFTIETQCDQVECGQVFNVVNFSSPHFSLPNQMLLLLLSQLLDLSQGLDYKQY